LFEVGAGTPGDLSIRSGDGGHQGGVRVVDKLTAVLVVELEKIALLVQLVGVTVKKGKNGLKLRDSVFIDVHHERLPGLHHRQGP
jgi:hypothetical protein